jgi:hypothetical protein
LHKFDQVFRIRHLVAIAPARERRPANRPESRTIDLAFAREIVPRRKREPRARRHGRRIAQHWHAHAGRL